MYALGLHTQADQIKIALLHKTKTGVEIELLRTFDSDVKPLYALASILEGKHVVVITGIGTQDLLVRETLLKLFSQEAILKALPFQVEALIPHPPEETIVQPFFEKEEEGTRLLLFATSQKLLDAHRGIYKKMGVEQEMVSSVPSALARFSAHFHQKREPQVICHPSPSGLSSCLLIEGRVRSSYFLASDQPKDIERLMAYFQKKVKGEPPLTFVRTDQGVDPESAEYAIPIGLALDALSDDGKSLQLLQEENEPTSVLGRRIKKALVYLGVSMALTIVIWGTTSFFVTKRRSLLFNELKSALHLETATEEKLLQEMRLLQRAEVSQFFKPQAPSPILELLLFLSEQEGIELKQLDYQEAPLGRKVVSLLFFAQSEMGDKFYTILKKSPLIDQKEPIAWELKLDVYKTSFYVR